MRHLISLFALVVAFSGCTDVNVDDFRRNQVRKELAKIRSISGIYNGQLASNQKNITFGAVTIEIQPDVKVEKSSDGLKSEIRAVFRGRLLYHGTPNAELFFDQGNYNEADGTFAATITIPDLSTSSTDTSKQLMLYGNIKSGKMVARLEAYGYPSSGGNMELTKGSQIVKPKTAEGELQSVVRVFKGSFNYGQDKNLPVTMTVTLQNNSAELFFFNQFLARRQVSVGLEFEKFQIYTEKAYFNGQSLSATFITSDPANSFANELQCQYDPNRADQIICALNNSRRGNFIKGVLKRVP